MAKRDKKAMRRKDEESIRTEHDDEVVGRPVGEMDPPDPDERDDDRGTRRRKRS